MHRKNRLSILNAACIGVTFNEKTLGLKKSTYLVKPEYIQLAQLSSQGTDTYGIAQYVNCTYENSTWNKNVIAPLPFKTTTETKNVEESRRFLKVFTAYLDK